MSKTSICWLACVVVLLAGCRNELELNAPYKEIPSIYAVLNPQDERQVIRINKIFLGEGDAGVMAKVADSVNYPAGELSVSLTRFVNDAQVDASPDDGGIKTIVFTEEYHEQHNQPGDFSRDQRLYVSDKKLFTSGRYVLTVKNNRTGNVFTASAEAIDRIKGNVFQPLGDVPQYPYDPFTPLSLYIDYSLYDGSLRFTPNEAKIYQAKIRTHYYDSSGNGKTYGYLDYDFGTREEKTKTSQGHLTYIGITFRKEDYWNAMGVALQKKNPTVNIFGRRVYMIEYIVYSSTQEYVDYLQYASPSFALTQNSPLYSNFENKAAIGIFTFRTRYSVKKEPASTMINEFSRNPNTCNYRFYDSELNIVGCR